MREELLALEEKLRNDIFEFAKENSNKSVEETLTMLGIKEYTLKDGVYHFTAHEIDTNDLVHMTYEKDHLHVLYTKGCGIPTSRIAAIARSLSSVFETFSCALIASSICLPTFINGFNEVIGS